MTGRNELAELRTTIIRIGLVSHAPVQQYNSDQRGGDSGEDIGGKKPPGTDWDEPRHPGPNASAKALAEYRDDYQAWLGSYQRKTPTYFLGRLGANPSARLVTELLAEARQVLECWRRMPIPEGQEPEYGSPQWKRYVANSPLDAGVLASRFNLTRQRIYQLRKEYRDVPEPFSRDRAVPRDGSVRHIM